MMVLFASIMLFSSCSKSEDNIVGKWKLVSCEDNVGGYVAEDSWDLYQIWEFASDGTCTIDGDEGCTYTYDSSANTLTISEYGVSLTFEVKKLTSSKMELLYFSVVTMVFEKQ